jgi:hypothetical protein
MSHLSSRDRALSLLCGPNPRGDNLPTVMAAMMVAMAMPCPSGEASAYQGRMSRVQAALIQGEKLAGQQKQLIRQFPNLGQCIAASEG